MRPRRTVIRPIRRFTSRSRVERRLLAGAFLHVLAITAALHLVPLVSLRQALGRLARRAASARGGEPPAVETLVWAVAAASRYVPRATCLARALALTTLLGRHGYPSQLRIGLGHRGDGALAGHAWVEGPDGRVITDEAPLPYTPLPLFDEVRSNGA